MMFKYSYNYFKDERLESGKFNEIHHIIARASRDVAQNYCRPFTITGDRGEILLIQKEIMDRIKEYDETKAKEPASPPTFTSGSSEVPAILAKVTNSDSASSTGLRLLIDSLYSLVDEVESGRLQITGGELIITYHPMDEGGAVSITSDLVLIPAPKGVK